MLICFTKKRQKSSDKRPMANLIVFTILECFNIGNVPSQNNATIIIYNRRVFMRLSAGIDYKRVT